MQNLKIHANNIRRNIIKAGYAGKHAHFGGSLSSADILAFLFSKQMSLTPEQKDKFILSKGHCALALYATLREFDFITEEQLLSMNSNGGDFPSHCVLNPQFGIDLSSGSLGLGLSFGIGKALALHDKGDVYVLLGNGEINEGSFWEAAMFAGCKGPNNLYMIVDDNDMQLDGFSSNVMPVSNWAERLQVFGWQTIEIDGHDFSSLQSVFAMKNADKPLAVVAHTVKGKGISFMENSPKWHHNHLTQEQYDAALLELRNN